MTSSFDRDLAELSGLSDSIVKGVEELRRGLTKLHSIYGKKGLVSLFNLVGDPKDASVSDLLRIVRALKEIRSLDTTTREHVFKEQE